MDAAAERRLHPFSWLFVLLTQLRHGFLPLLLLLLFGRGQWWELMVFLAAVALAVYSLVYSFGFRYRLGQTELVVREGIFDRTERHIPFARVQNIVQRRNPLHRLFDVTELRLESAGSAKPEAVMNVITAADAEKIEQILRAHGAADETQVAHDQQSSGSLLQLPLAELLRLGLVTNRGWAVVGAAFALMWQLGPEERSVARVAYRWIETMIGTGAKLIAGPFAWVLSAIVFAAGFVVILKLLSIVMAVVSFHRFRLDLDGERVRTEVGLLTRRVASARRDKIQRLVYGENALSRLLGRRWLSCEVAGGAAGHQGDDGARLHWLVPVASVATSESIAAEIAPGLVPAQQAWQALHPNAWRRMFKVWLAISAIPGLAVSFRFGTYGLMAWVGFLLWALIACRVEARFAAYACDDQIIAVRGGFLSRQWTLARIAKGQSVSMGSSVLDRRAGMATISMDTAGARPGAFRLRIRYLGEDAARGLFEHLQQRIDR